MKIRLDIFEGPLDLLLYLIKKDHLNIYDIPITKVVGQYIEFIELMQVLDINMASEYMVMAANLINIKSKMLLPRPPEEQQPEEDPRDELVRRLLEYEKFKEAAEFLKTKEKDRLKYVARSSSGDGASKEVFVEVSIFDLISAFKGALKEVPKEIFFEVIKDEFTVEAKVHDLLHFLVEHEKVNVNDLFTKARSKIEIVVTFLAILELIKLREVMIIQEELFGNIWMARRENLQVAV
jgi:segregation and condensation protein A